MPMSMDEMTITLGGDAPISVDVLSSQLENAMEMLRCVESSFTTADTIVRWEIVRVQMKSPLSVTVAPKVTGKRGKWIGTRIVKACMDGISGIEKTSRTKPAHFSEDALRAAQKMAKLSEKEGVSVTLSVDSKKVTLTNNVVENVEHMVTEVIKYTDTSTIEGTLEVISTHITPSVSIWETLTKYKIECHIDDDQLQKCLTLLNKRVAVTGHVTYRDHVPKTIKVNRIEELPGMNKILRLEDIPPINITGELTSEEHVRRMRHG